MRKYKNEQANELVQVCCNKCGRELKVERGIIQEGVFPVEIAWGYFSSKDGKRHKFDLCEQCYDEFVNGFVIGIDVSDENEMI